MNEIAFYRTKSAIQVTFIPPTMKKGDKGGQFCERGGTLLFSGANGENRNYNWGEKITFAVGLNDIPLMMNEWSLYKHNRLVYATTFSIMGDKTKTAVPVLNIELVHDPNKGREGEGALIKTLKITNGKPDKKGNPTYFLVVQTNQNGRVYVGLSEGEVEMIVGLGQALLPKFIGWAA